MSLGRALRVVLQDMDLTYSIQDDALLVTAWDESPEDPWQRALLPRTHPVDDLIGLDGSTEDRDAALDRLARLVSDSVHPWSWNGSGGSGEIHPAPLQDGSLLVVVQTAEVHQQVADFLAALHEMVQDAAAGRPLEPRVAMWDCQSSPEIEAIFTALRKKVTLDFQEKPLREVARSLSALSGVSVLLDVRAIGIPADTAVSFAVREMTLRSALRLMLRQLDLTFVIQDQVLLITTPDRLQRVRSLALYPVGDLLAGQKSSDQHWRDLDGLTSLITAAVAPYGWDSVGGFGSIVRVQSDDVQGLLVSQTRYVHQRIAELLTLLRRIDPQGDAAAAWKTAWLDKTPEDIAAREAIGEALRRRMTLKFERTPLSEVVARLREESKVEIVAAPIASAGPAAPADPPVTLDLTGVSLQTALELILDQLGLVWRIEGPALLITEPDDWRVATGQSDRRDSHGHGQELGRFPWRVVDRRNHFRQGEAPGGGSHRRGALPDRRNVGRASCQCRQSGGRPAAASEAPPGGVGSANPVYSPRLDVRTGLLRT